MDAENVGVLVKVLDYVKDGTLSEEDFPKESVLELIRSDFAKMRKEMEYVEYFYRYLFNSAIEQKDIKLLETIMEYVVNGTKQCNKTFVYFNELYEMYKKMENTEYINYAKQKGKLHNEGRKRSEKRMFEGKGVIYTVITSSYDELVLPQFVDETFDYICFTDNPDLKSDFWEIRMMSPSELDATRKSRLYKILCHRYLTEYDWSVYVDGKMQIVGDLREYIDTYSLSSPMLCFPHFFDDCIYQEAQNCIANKKDAETVILTQISRYREEGFPEEYGMIDAACMVRNHRDKKLQTVMEGWWDEVMHGSKRDQLSFCYVCWKNEFVYDTCDLFSNDNAYIKNVRKR